MQASFHCSRSAEYHYKKSMYYPTIINDFRHKIKNKNGCQLVDLPRQGRIVDRYRYVDVAETVQRKGNYFIML
jgi:hypothetical protein